MANRAILFLSSLWMILASPAAAAPRELLEIVSSGAGDRTVKALPGRPEVLSNRQVILHPEILASGDKDGGPRLPLLDGAVYDLERTGFERRGPDGFVWRGKVLVPGQTGGSATLTMMGGAMAGVISLPDALYEIVPVAGGGEGDHLLLEIAPGRFPACGGAELPAIARRALRAAPETVGKTGTTRIDLLVVYTASAVEAAGGERPLRVRIQNAVDVANTTFQNSEIDARLNLVHAERIPTWRRTAPTPSCAG